MKRKYKEERCEKAIGRIGKKTNPHAYNRKKKKVILMKQ